MVPTYPPFAIVVMAKERTTGVGPIQTNNLKLRLLKLLQLEYNILAKILRKVRSPSVVVTRVVIAQTALILNRMMGGAVKRNDK